MTDASEGSEAPKPPTRAEARREAERPAGLQAHMRQARSDLEQHVERARADFENANERINARSGRNLLGAIAIALVIGGLFIASVVLFDWLFLIFAVAIAGLGVFEFSRALAVAGYRVDAWPQVAVTVVFLGAAYLLDPGTLWVVVSLGVAVLVVWRLLAQMAAAAARDARLVIRDVMVAAFIPLYVGLLAALAVLLLREPDGWLWILSMVGVIVAVDTGAYVAGLSFGKHPMAPRVSPKKTWEGFAGGAVAAIGIGILVALVFLDAPWWIGVILGVALLGSATVGDLTESMIKRDLGIKDMSSWLPGHGGVLDRLDSMLPSVPVALGLYYATEWLVQI